MILKTHTPSSLLNRYVAQMIYFSGYQPKHSIERIVPDTMVTLVVELDNKPRCIYDNVTQEPIEEFSSAWFSGFHKGYISIQAVPDSEMFVIMFRPGGAFPFLHKPLDIYTGKVVNAKAVFGNDVIGLRNDLLEEKDADQRFTIAKKWLHQRMDSESIPEKVIGSAIEMIQDNTYDTLLKLVEKSGYSQKQFIFLFKKFVGVTPKYFQRILRFNEILPKIHNKEKINWAQLGAECGYADQAHFIKEFKEFSGFNPSKYLTDYGDLDRYNFFPID